MQLNYQAINVDIRLQNYRKGAWAGIEPRDLYTVESDFGFGKRDLREWAFSYQANL